MNLNEITYPVFKLGVEEPQRQDGVLFFLAEGTKETEEGLETEWRIRIVDDTNLPGDTLARRRLLIRNNGGTPFKLNRAIFFLGDLIKMAVPKLWFIDSMGKCFRYTKNTRARLTYRKVTKVIHVIGGGAIIEVEGIPSRMKSLFMPTLDNLHAGVLLMGVSPILYGFYDKKHEDSWRMV
jgi:hypothetical protein